MKTTRRFRKLRDLTDKELDEFYQPIEPLGSWPEYANFITDYSQRAISVTNRLIPPYITSQAHGERVFDELLEEVNHFKPETLVDLGCASGEFLSKLDCDGYGLTIHVGEVKHARTVFGLRNVIPADMREVGKYFRVRSVDMVVAMWSFEYLTQEDRLKTMAGVEKILKPNGKFIHVSDGRYPQSTFEYQGKAFRLIHTKEIKPTNGRLSVFAKNVRSSMQND